MLGRLGSQKPVWLEQSEWGWESLGQRNWHQILANLVKWLHTLSCERIRATASCSYSDPTLNKCSFLYSDNWIHIVLLLVGGWGMDWGISQRKTCIFILIISFAEITPLIFPFPLDSEHLLCPNTSVTQEYEKLFPGFPHWNVGSLRTALFLFIYLFFGSDTG